MEIYGSRGWRSGLGGLIRIGADPADTREQALRKETLVLSASVITVLAVVWVASYWAMGLYLSAAIPFAYQVVSIANLALFAKTGRFRFFRWCELGLSLVLPFALQLSLGGFIPSSGVVLWSFTAPLGALLFADRREAVRWFTAFVALIALAGALDPVLANKAIPGWVNVLFFALNVLGVTGTCFFLLHYFVRERDHAAEMVKYERERSERLLLNVLPEPIAERLKSGESVIADGVQAVGVLFADIAGFTPMTAAMEPAEIVRLLDEVFSEFDTLVERHGLEKIKTIGDAYMVASGLLGSSHRSAENLAQVALEMLETVRPRAPLALRIGIDIGPVVAGVIGRRKFIYDLWGDTVNTASRMESHGVAGAIQVTERAYESLRQVFELEDRGVVEIKGKGPMHTYLLTAQRVNPAEEEGGQTVDDRAAR